MLRFHNELIIESFTTHTQQDLSIVFDKTGEEGQAEKKEELETASQRCTLLELISMCC